MRIKVLIPFLKDEKENVIHNLKNLIPFSQNMKVYVVGPEKIKMKRVISIVEKKRKGKSYWIKKILLKEKEGILILISGDVKVEKNFLQRSLSLMKKDVGMICCRITPENPKNFVEKLGFLIWKVHNEVSKLQPKGGEAIVFRAGIVGRFHEKVVTDEAYIEANIARSGLKIIYQEKLLAKNKLASHISEFFSQRVRYHVGHLQTLKEMKYKVVSLKYFLLLKAVVNILKKNPHFLPLFFPLVFFETLARLYGRILFSLNILPYKWKIARSARG